MCERVGGGVRGGGVRGGFIHISDMFENDFDKGGSIVMSLS